MQSLPELNLSDYNVADYTIKPTHSSYSLNAKEYHAKANY